jgi:hypothetical protein
MDYTAPLLLLLFVLVMILVFAGYAVYYLERIAKDARLVQQLLTAYMKKSVAGTVADHELAQVVREAEKAATPAGVAR